MEVSKNHYVELAKIDVGEHIEKKGKFSYLSWAWAVDVLRRHDPSATWETIRFNGMPFMKTECGYFVEVAVTVQGITLSQIHPVLDNNNKPIVQPNAFQINTSIQRCLVKAIALHGLGLYIYAGEDLPFDEETDPEPKKPQGSPSNPGPSNLSTLKAKWQTLSPNNNLDGFDAWVKGQQAKGYGERQMESYLTKKLNEKKGA